MLQLNLSQKLTEEKCRFVSEVPHPDHILLGNGQLRSDLIGRASLEYHRFELGENLNTQVDAPGTISRCRRTSVVCAELHQGLSCSMVKPSIFIIPANKEYLWPSIWLAWIYDVMNMNTWCDELDCGKIYCFQVFIIRFYPIFMWLCGFRFKTGLSLDWLSQFSLWPGSLYELLYCPCCTGIIVIHLPGTVCQSIKAHKITKKGLSTILPQALPIPCTVWWSMQVALGPECMFSNFVDPLMVSDWAFWLHMA